MNFVEQESVHLPSAARFHISKLEDKYREQVLSMASTLVSLLDLKDCYTGGHSTRVATYSRLIALELNLDETELEMIVMAASLHDIGKIGVPDHVLLKPGKLNDEEFGQVKKHSEFGWMVLRNIEGFEEASMMLLHHHERFGGGGYPGDLEGHQIPLGARIIAVGDAFDALTTDRSYRKGRSEDQAIHEIVRCKDIQFDPMIVEAFCRAMGY
jgi:HD-GYP domain-containing protein (c-di-GMP phosphodiesterase class II)